MRAIRAGARVRATGRQLGRVWVTVLFSVLMVSGVTTVLVAGLEDARSGEAAAADGQVAARLTGLVERALRALQDERTTGVIWLDDPTVASGRQYRAAAVASDDALRVLRAGWLDESVALADADPPTLSDINDAVEPLPALRDSVLRLEEESIFGAYATVMSPLVDVPVSLRGLVEDPRLAPQFRALGRLVTASEGLGGLRSFVLERLSGGGVEVDQDDVVQISLLAGEVESAVQAARVLRSPTEGAAIGEFLVEIMSDDTASMVDRLAAGDASGVDAAAWLDASTRRVNDLRSILDRETEILVGETNRLRALAAQTTTQRLIGLGVLWLVSVGAALAAVRAARDRARALAEHGALADGLIEWFLPSAFPEVGDIRVAARYDAASDYARAGGDWYDIYRLDDGRLAVTIGDVAGHGPAATAEMAQLRYLLKGITLAGAGTPASQLVALDAAVHDLPTMATVFHGVLDPDRGVLIYSRAGHPVCLSGGSGGVVPLDGALGPPIGISSDADRTDATIELSRPVRLVFFTDGLVEERGTPVEDGIETVARIVTRVDMDAEQVADALIATRPVREDDAAVLVVELPAAAQRVSPRPSPGPRAGP